jgi:ArsR family transcriptional regulator
VTEDLDVDGDPTGDELLHVLAALANPIRLRIVASLAGGRDYVSRLARELKISRPLLHMHVQRLEAAGLVVGTLELSDDGKAMKFYEVASFDFRLTAQTVAEAVKTLSAPAPEKASDRKKET